MRARAEFGVALLLLLLGAGAALLISTRTWQTVTVVRTGLVSVHLDLTGRTVDGAGTALALAALAAIVALLATRGVARQVIGALVTCLGVATIWRAVEAADAVDAARARSLLRDRHHGVVLDAAAPRVDVHGVWPWLAVVSGVLITASGLLVLLRGRQWQGLAARYRPPTGTDDASGDLAMWKALDRGDDPTV